MIRPSAFLFAAVLAAGAWGCTYEPLPPFDVTTPFIPPAPFEVPYTGYVVGNPDFAHAPFVTNAEVALRRTEEDESSVVAMVPEGTPVVPVGSTGGECMCWRVTTPQGTGWVYNRYLDLHAFASAE